LFAVTTCLPDASAFRMKVRAGSRPVGVADQREPPEVESLARPGEIGVGDAAEHEPAAGARLHLRAVTLEHLDHATADRAEAQEGDLDLVHHTRRGAALAQVRSERTLFLGEVSEGAAAAPSDVIGS